MEASAAALRQFDGPSREPGDTHQGHPVSRGKGRHRPEPPASAFFVCNCGINIGGVVDVPAVRDYAATLPYVAHVDENLFTCSQDTQAKIKQAIEDNQLNRVIVASCSPPHP